MSRVFTISDLQKSACAGRNPQLFENKPSEKKKRGRPTKNESAALSKLKWDLEIWSKMKGYKLESEFRFHEYMKYRFDFCFPDFKVAVEFEGGVFIKNSGHNTAKHYTKDTEKYNLAASEGWTVLRFTALNAKNVLQDLEKLIKPQI